MSFIAAYRGECADGDDIAPGDEVRYNLLDELVHVRCPATDLPKDRVDICPRCFIAKSISGACGCED